MQLVIDETEISWSGGTFADLQQLIERELTGGQKIIASISCDGQEIEPQALEECVNRGISILRIYTTDVAEIVLQGLSSAMEYLPRLREGLKEVVALVEEGSEGQAVNLFLQAIEGLEWLNSLVQSVATFGVDGTASEGIRQRVDTGVAAFGQKMSLLLEAWENNDYLLIGDVLGYEIIPLLEEWEELARLLTVSH